MNLLTQEEVYCRRMKFTVTGRNLMTQVFPVDSRGISSEENELPETRRNFQSQEEIYCHRKTFTVTRRNLLSQEEIYCHRKKSSITGSIFL